MTEHSREDYDKGIATARKVRDLMIGCGAVLGGALLLPSGVIVAAIGGCASLALTFHGLVILFNNTKPAAKKREPETANAARARAWVGIVDAQAQAAAAQREILYKQMRARAKAIQDAEAARRRTAALERKLYGLKRANGREINRGPIIDITPEKS